MSVPDFIEVYDNALTAADCATIVERLRRSTQLKPGQVGGGVFPELKRSHDLRISGNDPWVFFSSPVGNVLWAALAISLAIPSIVQWRRNRAAARIAAA